MTKVLQLLGQKSRFIEILKQDTEVSLLASLYHMMHIENICAQFSESVL